MPDDFDKISREYAEVYEKHGPAWAEAFNKDRGAGWRVLAIRPRTVFERNKVFVDFARQGYQVHIEPIRGEYHIYVKGRR